MSVIDILPLCSESVLHRWLVILEPCFTSTCQEHWGNPGGLSPWLWGASFGLLLAYAVDILWCSPSSLWFPDWPHFVGREVFFLWFAALLPADQVWLTASPPLPSVGCSHVLLRAAGFPAWGKHCLFQDRSFLAFCNTVVYKKYILGYSDDRNMFLISILSSPMAPGSQLPKLLEFPE